MNIPTIEIVKISKLKLNPNNPRLIKDERYQKLLKSIQDFPDMLKIRPVVVNKDMIVLGGNMRLKACQVAVLIEIPVIHAEDLTDEQQRMFIIKDNIQHGDWDWEMLANEWDPEMLADWGVMKKDWDSEADLSDKNKEVDQADLTKDLDCTCPKCGFQFAKQK